MCSFITHIMSIVDTIVLLLYWSNHAMRQYASSMIKDNQRMEDKGWIPSSQTSHNTEVDGWKDSSQQWPLTGTDCSLIFSVSGDKCQARLNCYANTDSQIIPILVPSPSPSNTSISPPHWLHYQSLAHWRVRRKRELEKLRSISTASKSRNTM